METILVTGANGEVGHGLIKKLEDDRINLITLDIADLDKNLSSSVRSFYTGSITDKNLVEKVFRENKIDTIFHLAAVLSTSGEKNPYLAHKVNVEGTVNLLESIIKQNHPIKFIFPSSIAAYGIPNLVAKKRSGKVKENDFLNPITMYGINKLYCERLGIYYSHYYRLLEEGSPRHLDFRCLRFPGLISADTIPSGGTSDYASEMVHYAAQEKPYKCFVRADSQIPFMAMPDAINALILLFNAPRNKLSQSVYNVCGFSATASEIEKVVKRIFPKTKITYKINSARQKIIDSWPKDVDDTRSRIDWGFKAKYTFKKAFEDYLILEIKKKYGRKK